MKPNFIKTLATACLFSIISVAAQAQTAPSEVTRAAVQRDITTASTVTGYLSKNEYRIESYQANYTVSVPYQATETYEEQVPYQEQVPYTDYETEYRNEERCENVTRYRNEQQCRNITRYRQQCTNQQQCHLVPGTGPTCQQVQECGVNAHGQRICKTREVCSGGSSGHQQCKTVPVCSQVPYTTQECNTVSVPYYDRVCRSVNVPYERPVTRYRTETRYRSETRTRTVTKHRDESRCCVTKTREVFDKQLQYQVNVVFPNAATLIAGESESFFVTLKNNNPLNVELTIQNSIYAYSILSNVVSGSVVTIQLGLLPKYTINNAGQDSITSLSAQYSNQLGEFIVSVNDSIADSVVASRIKSNRSITIKDLATGAVIETQNVSNLPNGGLGIIINAPLAKDAKFIIELSVNRVGQLVQAGGISFIKTAIYEKRSLLPNEVALLSSSSMVQLLALNTSGYNSSISLIDTTEEFADVNTVYNITTYEMLPNDDRITLGKATVTREQLKANNNSVLLSSILSANAANSGLRAGKTLRFHVEVLRNSTSGLLAAPISFHVKANLKVN